MLGTISWTQASNKPITVALIQGDIPLLEKWDPTAIAAILKTYYNLTTKTQGSQLIIWPEAAIPVFKQQAPIFLSSVATLARTNHSIIISGIPRFDIKTGRYYNSMLNINTGNYYDKRRLVPFGEYLPLKFMTKWLLNYLKIPMADFSSGTNKQKPFNAGSLQIAPAICYEIAYPTLLTPYFPQAKLIITITEDAWFGHSIAAAQHLQMAQMRSVETGRYQLVATNTGITAIIAPDGNIIAKAPSFKRYILRGKIHAMHGTTPWLKFARLI